MTPAKPAFKSFASVKLPESLVQQARDAAQPLRRSTAGQIEYWATLGRIVEHSGLTVQEARLAIERYEALPSDSLKAIKQRILASNANGSLQTQIRRIVEDNRQKAQLRQAA